MPRMLRDIVGTILDGQPDLEIVGELDTGEVLIACAEQTQPDFLIIGPEPAAVAASKRLLADSRPLRVLEVVEEGRTGYLYEWSPERILVGDISPDALLAAVRGS
jgi:chemotaxis response regulator CheB